MQNFTFGRKGTNWFLFAFVLLIGTLPSFGQACPTPGDFPASQTFCFTETIGDLDSAGYPVYQTDDNQNDTQAIPQEEFLVNGTYYVGGASGTCTRLPITVTVNSAPRPFNIVTNSITSGFEISSCTPANFGSAELEDLFEAVTGYTIEVYDSEFGTTAFNGPLQAGESYFVAQVPTGAQDAQNSVCPSERVAVGFNPNQIEAPATENAQVLCEEATVADLVAEGTYNNTQAIRWYRSQNAVSPLAETTKLISGQTYYVGQVVNERGNPMPPCETPAADRAAVTVTLEAFDAGPDVSETLCQSDLQARLEAGESPTAIFTSYITNVPANSSITFNPSISSIEADYNNNPFQTFTTTATITTDAGCEDDVQIALEIVEEFEAGDDNTDTVLCRSQLAGPLTEAEVEVFFRDLLSADADTNGTFNNETIAEITNRFNSGDGIGTYTTTYTVGAGTGCEDSAQLAVTVNEDEPANAGTIGDINLVCASEIVVLDDSLLSADATTGGTFSADAGVLDQNGNFDSSIVGPGQYEITYTVDDSILCVEPGTSDATSFTIFVSEDSEDLTDIFEVLCNDQIIEEPTVSGVRAYLLERVFANTGLPTTGTFTNGTPQEIFDAFQQNRFQTFKTTYTVDSNCGEVSVDYYVEVIESEAANAGNINDQVVCTTEGMVVLTDYLEADAQKIGSFSGQGVTNGMFDPSIGPNENGYEITYTVGEEDADCIVGTDSTNFTITVQEPGPANAGSFEDISLTCNATDIIVFDNLDNLDANASTGGVFTADDNSVLNADGNFDPSLATPGETYTITYTVDDSAPCTTGGTDTTSFTITLNEGTQEVADVSEVLCNAQIEPNPTVSGVRAYLLERIFANTGLPTTGTFTNGTPEEIFEEFQQNRFQTFTTTYTVVNNCGEVSVNYSVEVVEETEANAGSFENLTLSCSATDIIVFNDLDNLDANASTGGVFTANDDSVLNADGNFDPSLATPGETYTITYTVDDSAFCTVEDSFDSTSFEITVDTTANAGNDVEGTICLSEVIEIAEDFDPTNPDATLTDLFGRFNWNGDTNGTFEPSAIELGLELLAYYQNENRAPFLLLEGTYTVGEDNSSCGTDTANFSITILDEQEAVAEANNQTINVCTSEASYDLYDALTDATTPGGSFTLNGEAFTGSSFDAVSAGEGTYEFTYTVGEDDLECLENTATTSFTIDVTSDFDFGNQITDVLCESEVQDNLTAEIIENYYLELVSALPSGGSFSTSPEELLEQYNNNPIGTFTTTYSVESGECQGSVEVSVTVQAEGDANAGNIADQVVCSTEGMIDLSDYLAGSGAQLGGTFTGDGVTNGMFDTSVGPNENGYEITYTVNETVPCVTPGTSDSSSFTIQVIDEQEAVAEANNQTINVCTSEASYDLYDALTDATTPGGSFSLDGETFTGSSFDAVSAGEGTYEFTYTVGEDNLECVEGSASATFTVNVTADTFDAGEDANLTVCVSELDSEPTLVEVRNYFLNLLSDGVPTNGTFEPGMEEIRQEYLNNPIGTFTTTYTLGGGSCSDSAVLTVEVIDAIDANTGEIEDQTLCSSDADLNLYTLLSEDANPNGVFEGYENGIFSPSTIGAGTYEVTYSVTEDAPCVVGEASTTFTIEVLQGANAGEDMQVTICDNQGAQNLFDYISADADMDGTFSDLADGIFDPAEFEAGSYEFTYTVTSDAEQCGGDDVATITVDLFVAPDAPTTGEAIAFCAIDGETAARLEAQGTNLTWYSDADLTMMVNEEDLLVNGDYYVTQSSDEGCESEAAVLTVNIVDSPAPTISSDYELCEFDNPTIADLSAEINESGEVTWYESADSMNALSNNATLTDGTTYYATLISDNGCESSERLAVTVTLEDCALLFPEAITPNGDGRNDRFVIENIEREYPNFNITIFNRWGNAVYKGNASTPTWDGTSNQSGSLGDDVLPVGVYFYVVDFNDGSTEPRQGKVYLNR